MKWLKLSIPLWILIAVTLTYSGHFWNEFHFDDHHTIVNNPAIRSLKNIPSFFEDARPFSVFPPNRSYRPVVTTVLALDYAAGKGLNPPYFHLSTFIAFLLQLLFMGAIFERIVKNRYQAWLAVALYGLHPVSAETVNYIIQRADLYVGLGLCAGLYFYMKDRHGFAILAFTLGVLSKQSGAVFPAIIISYEYFLGTRNYRKTLPYIALGIVLIYLHSLMRPDTYLVGANGEIYQYWATQPYLAMTYLRETVAPFHLSADNEMLPFDNTLHPLAVVGYVGLIAVLGVIWKGGSPAVSFGLTWFLIALSPTALVPLGDVTNDHRMYAPYVGIALIAAVLAQKKLLRVLFTLSLPLLAYGTTLRNEVWRTDKGLWEDVVRKRPRNARAWLNLGVCLLQENRPIEAYAAMQESKKLEDSYIYLELNLAIACQHLKRFAEAEHHFKRGTRLDPGGSPLYAYGMFLMERGRLKEAVPLLVESNRRNPHDLKAIHRLVWLLEEEDRKCRELRSAKAWIDYSVLLCLAEDYTQATRASRNAIELEPKNALAHNNLAACELGNKHWKQAKDAATEALKLDPKLEVAQRNLKRAEAQLRKEP